MNWSEIQAIRVYRTRNFAENGIAGKTACELFDFEDEKILTVMLGNNYIEGGWEEIIEGDEMWNSIIDMQQRCNQEIYKIKHAEILRNDIWEDISEEKLFAIANEFHKEFCEKGE